MVSEVFPNHFKPNFGNTFEVIINQPIERVFTALGTGGEGLSQHILLSPLASNFVAGTRDDVSIQGNLEDSFTRPQPGTTGEGEGIQTFPRQSFKFLETVKLIPGLSFTDVKVNLEGTFTWDESRKLALYESTSDQSVTVKKIRKFESMNGGAATKVSEEIVGRCNFYLQPIVQSTAKRAHINHMSLYSNLF